MRFVVDPSRDAPRVEGTLLLRLSEWNDWFKFRTLFTLSYIDDDLTIVRIGNVKIADITHEYANQREYATPLPEEFTELVPRDRYVSVGQSEEYYERFRDILGTDRMREALHALGDLAEDPARLDAVR